MTGCNMSSYDPAPSLDNLPIEVGISDDWSSMTKTVYDSANDIPSGDGFVVWALCITDPEASPQPAPEVIFGNAGTKTYAPSWTYSPTRYWQKGTYTFAAAIPASAFNADFASTEAGKKGKSNISGTFSEGTLTLNCGSAGYNLADSQDDIMVAFSNIDNLNSTMGTVVGGVTKKVSFTFEHQLSQVSIAAINVDKNVDITVQEVEIYGPHKSTSGSMTFTYNGGVITPSWSYSEQAPGTLYKAFKLAGEQGLLSKSAQGSTSTYKPIVSEILVFPEECTMTVRVKYIATMSGESSNAIYGSVDIPVDWQSGLNYAYKLRVSSSSITFTSSIQSWDDDTFKDIPHEFN